MKRELTLDELLADPLVLTVMRADRIHPEKVGRQLRRIGDRLNNTADGNSVPCWIAAKSLGEACTW